MPRLDQFLIAPMTEGLRTDVPPWLIPEEAFAELQNAYVWRGKLRKRFGSRYLPSTSSVAGKEQLVSRLRIAVDTTDGAGAASGTVPNAATDANIGQMFSIGEEVFTVYQATGNMYKTGSSTTFTFDTTTGAYVFAGSDLTTSVFWYPSLPVMGIVNYEKANVNSEDTFAFDTRFAYKYGATGWLRLGTGSGTPNTWTGIDSQFFWAENHRINNTSARLLFVTNNSSTDNVRYWNGTAWTALVPDYDTAGVPGTITGCRLIITFKDRLLFLNTYETPSGGGASVNFPNRVRYSVNGSPLSADSWLEGTSTSGKGGFINAPTTEAIISAKVLRDRLVVFFERSTWEIVFSGNKVQPFFWQRINSEIGAESTFSTVLFDKVLLGVGNVGIHACTGANVERIDQKIPQAVFEFHNGNQGIDRVAGIRDYTDELVYWTLPDEQENPVYPTRVLVYNYKNKTWAINDDSITAFGYVQNQADLTWAELNMPWSEWNEPWGSGTLQFDHRYVMGGNQEGYTFIVDPNVPRNVGALQITELVDVGGVITVTAYRHNLVTGDYVLIENISGATGFDGIYQVTVDTTKTDEFTVNEPNFGGTYSGGGTIARVSKIDIQTKEYNFYMKDGSDLFIPKIAFYVDKTTAGEITLEYYTSSSTVGMVQGGDLTGAALSTGILETRPYDATSFEGTQKRFWHVMYPQAQGEVIQIHMFLDLVSLQKKYNNNEITMAEFRQIALSDFTLNAMSIYSRAIKRY